MAKLALYEAWIWYGEYRQLLLSLLAFLASPLRCDTVMLPKLPSRDDKS